MWALISLELQHCSDKTVQRELRGKDEESLHPRLHPWEDFMVKFIVTSERSLGAGDTIPIANNLFWLLMSCAATAACKRDPDEDVFTIGWKYEHFLSIKLKHVCHVTLNTFQYSRNWNQIFWLWTPWGAFSRAHCDHRPWQLPPGKPEPGTIITHYPICHHWSTNQLIDQCKTQCTVIIFKLFQTCFDCWRL